MNIRIIYTFLLSVLFCTSIQAGTKKHQREAWMDSVIAEGVQKIREAETNKLSGAYPLLDITGNYYGSHYIVIDAANWTPIVVENEFYYQREATGSYINAAGLPIRDSVDSYNLEFKNRQDYIGYYNIVILNLPFPLEKDVSNIGNHEGQTMFAQLQALGAIDNQKYYDATWKLKDIVDGVVSQATSFTSGRIVCYGIANMLGQYSAQSQARASFGCEYIGYQGLDTNLLWVRQMGQIPKLLKCPYCAVTPPTLKEKNSQVSMAVRNFILCNQYGVCIPDANVFTNIYARWLFTKLAGNGVIDQAKLMSTCMSLNQLSGEMAWSVLTADYENTYTQFNTQALSITYYSNSTLDTISGLVGSILRGADQFRNNASIGHDSALYYGRLLYRMPTYINGIPCTQRIRLMGVITSQVCNDITDVTSASDYANHCERICKALYTYLPETDIKPFMDQLKSSGVIWDVTYKLDNQFLGFFGNDNYTDFIFTISAYWKKAYPQLATDSSQCLVIKWSSDYFNSNSFIQPQKSHNQILVRQQKRVGWQYFGLNYADTNFIADIYSPVMIHVNEGSFIPDLPGVKDLIVPAIFMDWLSHKKLLDDAATTVHVTLAVAALATGVGEFYTAASTTMRIISAVEIAVSASDLILLNQQVRQSIINQFPTPQEGEAFLAAYERITMVINLSVAAKGLITHIESDFVNYVSKFDEEEAGIKAVLGENSAEFKGMQKLKEELNTARTNTTTQLAATSNFDINAIIPKLATQPNTAFFWSGKTNGIGGQDVAMQIALNRGGVTLESKIATENIQMPEWNLSMPSSVQAWEQVSAAYANQVSGEIHAVVGQQLRPGNIWETVELPRLKANPNVTKITIIDPQSYTETVIFTRE